VDDLNLSVEAGEIFCFLGPNGAGKSTTIKMLTGVLTPTAGQVIIDGQDMAKQPLKAKARVGYVPEQPFLYDKLTAVETLRFVARLHGLSPDVARQRGEALLNRFGLSEARHRLVEGYSHGMKQRLAYCMALLHDPPILVADEPLVGLDPAAARQVKDILKAKAADEGTTIFMCTHLLPVAEELAHRVGIIHQGRLIAWEDIVSLKARYDLASESLETLFLKLVGA